MKDLLCDGFQEAVEEFLVRHRSILDVESKLQEANARINRAIAKAVTSCGCVQIAAGKQRVPVDVSLQDLKNYMGTHLQGELCEHCKEVVESEIGASLFYLAALCNLLNLNLYDIMLTEHKKVSALGLFNFT
ncbi:MAG: DUF1573 domain-containing protein [Firmicutes bacterium]|nr:DUF1573 domain-containing protein [Bacillota bacterium]